MDDPVAFFFEEVWRHRRNGFIAVGGVALFLLFVALALQPIPWLPEELKQTMMFLAMAFIAATMLFMLYYALKFIFIASAWILKKAFRLFKHEQPSSMNRGELDR